MGTHGNPTPCWNPALGSLQIAILLEQTGTTAAKASFKGVVDILTRTSIGRIFLQTTTGASLGNILLRESLILEHHL